MLGDGAEAAWPKPYILHLRFNSCRPRLGTCFPRAKSILVCLLTPPHLCKTLQLTTGEPGTSPGYLSQPGGSSFPTIARLPPRKPSQERVPSGRPNFSPIPIRPPHLIKFPGPTMGHQRCISSPPSSNVGHLPQFAQPLPHLSHSPLLFLSNEAQCYSTHTHTNTNLPPTSQLCPLAQLPLHIQDDPSVQRLPVTGTACAKPRLF